MKKSYYILGFFILLLIGCASPSEQQTAAQPSTLVPLTSSITATFPKATTTNTLAPTQTASLTPDPTKTPAPIPPGISADNFSDFAVTTQYLPALRKAVKDLPDMYALDAFVGSQDGRYVAIGGCTNGYRFSCPNSILGNHSFLVILDAFSTQIVSVLPENETTITGLEFTSNSSQLIYATYPQKVVIWDIPSQTLVRTLFNDSQADTKIRMRVNPDGKTVAVSSVTSLMIFETASGKLEEKIPAAGFMPFYSADGSRLAISSNEGGSEITVYDTASWQKISRIQIPDQSNSGFSLDLSPDGNWIITHPVSEEPVIRLWNANTGEQVRLLEKPSRELYSIEFSPNSQLLFVSYNSDLEMVGKINVWDVASWQQLGVISSYLGNGHLTLNSTGEFMLASNGTDLWRWSLMDGQTINSRQVVVDFFDALSRGDYPAAAALYQPAEEDIKYLNSIGLDTSNMVSLLEQICASNKYICLPVLKVIPGGGLSGFDEYEVFVQFRDPGGSAFMSSYGSTDQYVLVGMDLHQNWKIHFIPYKE